MVQFYEQKALAYSDIAHAVAIAKFKYNLTCSEVIAILKDLLKRYCSGKKMGL